MQCEAKALFVRLTFNLFYLHLCRENVVKIRQNVVAEVLNWLVFYFLSTLSKLCNFKTAFDNTAQVGIAIRNIHIMLFTVSFTLA